MTNENPRPSGSGGTEQPLLDMSHAMLPTEATLRGRKNLLTQVGRFVSFNLRLMRMVLAGHH